MADIVITMRDNFSVKVNSITNANKGFNKSLEETIRQSDAYSKKIIALNSSLAKQQTQLQKARREVKDAEKALRQCANSANDEALTAAYRKYNQLQDGIKSTKLSIKETRTELRKLNDEAGLFIQNTLCETGLPGRQRFFRPDTEEVPRRS